MGKKRSLDTEQVPKEFKAMISLQSARGYELSLPRDTVTANSSERLYDKVQALLDELMQTPTIRKRAKKCTMRAMAPGRPDIWLRANSLADLQDEFDTEYANRLAKRIADTNLQKEICHDYADLDSAEFFKGIEHSLGQPSLPLCEDSSYDYPTPMIDQLLKEMDWKSMEKKELVEQ